MGFLVGLLTLLDAFVDAKAAGMFLMFDMANKVTSKSMVDVTTGVNRKEVVSFKEELKGATLRRDYICFIAYRSMLQVH
jgi:hypothetical protein